MAALPNDADLDIKSVFPEIVRGGGAAMLKSVVEVYSAKFEKAPPSPPPRPLSFAIWPPPATLLGGSRCRSRRGATEGEEDKKAIISVIGDASADAFDFKAESASSSMWGPAFPPCLSLSHTHTHTHTHILSHSPLSHTRRPLSAC